MGVGQRLDEGSVSYFVIEAKILDHTLGLLSFITNTVHSQLSYITTLSRKIRIYCLMILEEEAFPSILHLYRPL